ncbi:MAG: methyltransferase, partial [Microbacteriaceae bacterium]
MPDTPVLQPDLIDRLRADLDAAAYTVDRLRTLWGDSADDALTRGDRVPALRALGEATPAGTLARLFILGMPGRVADVEAALPTLGASGAERLGLLRADDDALVPLVDLRPYSVVDASGVAAWWIVSDLGEIATGGELRTDHVLGVGGASATLSGLQLPDPVDSILDLGTGCGIQALHASRFARRVVATDVSERALDFARFTAALNGIDSIEFRLGDMFAPVAGERFDRIVSNPP